MNATASFAERQKGFLPDLLGLEVNLDDPALITGRFAVTKHHVAPNGFLHAASVIGLVDTACGYGCAAALMIQAKRGHAVTVPATASMRAAW